MILSFNDKSPKIHESCFIAPDSVIIGDVNIGPNTSIWFNAVLRGDIHYIRIGSFCNIQDGCVVHVDIGKAPTEVGDYVTVGHRAVLHGCVVESNSLIGMGAVILDNAVVGTGSIVAAGAVVKVGMKIPDHSMVAGNPAVIKRKVSDDEVEILVGHAKKYREWARSYKF